MAKLKIVGRGWINVSQKVADNVARWKSEGKFEDDHVIDLGVEGFVELGQIKQVIPDDPTALKESEISEEKQRERIKEIAEFNAYVDKVRQENPEQKARRVVESWALIAYIAKGNQPERGEDNRLYIPKNVADDIMLKLIPYFEANPAEWTCTKKEYWDLLPIGKKVSPVLQSVQESLIK
jgi:hypothetical protein